MTHRPLKQNEIRLLQLPPRPSQGASEVDLVFKFFHALLEDTPSFGALSYAWGNVTDTQQINLDGEPFTVTTSLLNILKDLQLHGAPRTIWVDAICINQNDLVERGEQVALMQRIYQSATTVVVYLGEAWEGHDLAFGFFETAAANPDHHYEPSLEPHLSFQGHTANSELLKQNLVRFLSLPWWRRLWTGQEYALARQLTFQCGTDVLDGDVVRRAYSNLRSHEGNCCWDSPSVARDASFGISLLHAFFRMDATEMARDCAGGHNPAPLPEETRVEFRNSLPGHDGGPICTHFRSITFLEGLDNFRPRESSDTRDKIYGCTGLYYSDDVARLFARPDYRVPAEELYTTLAHAMIRETGSLDVLARAGGHCAPTLALPSFVPDWSVGHPVEINRFAHLSYQYDASAGRVADWAVVESGRARTPALLVDSLGRFGPRLGEGGELGAALDDWAALAGLGTAGGGGDAFAERTGMFSKDADFWRVLCGNMVSFRVGTVQFTLLDMETEFKAQAEEHAYRSYLDWYTYSTRRPGSVISGIEVTGFQSSFLSQYTTRRFAVTAGGRMGNVPETAVDGDVVAVLPGGNVPFILRLVSAETMTYEVVGAAYIHGIMIGQAFRGDPVLESIFLV